MKSHRSRFAWIVLAPLVAFSPALVAAPQDASTAPPLDSEITLQLIANPRPRLRLAVPAPDRQVGASGPAVDAAAELMAVLRADLEASGVFLVQGPEQLSILDLSGDPVRDRELYRSLNNELLLQSTLRLDPADPSTLVYEGRVFQLSDAQAILGKRYRGGFDLARRIAHTWSDEIVRWFTGEAGVALTAIAFHSDRVASDRREVYLMDYDGWNQRRITAHETLSMYPAWSANGDTIAYLTYLGMRTGIYFVDVQTGAKTPIITDGTFNASPAFSPDGRRLAFSRSVGGGNTEIFIADRGGRNLQRLTTSSGIDTNPAWSPTGRELAFTSSRSGRPQIYVMSAEGTDLRRVTFAGNYNDGAEWSPDGRRLAHSSRRRSGDSFDLAVTDLTTSETRLLTEGVAGSHEAPSFSPDGRKVAYTTSFSTRNGSTIQIWVVDLQTGERRQLTREGNNWAPDWSGYLP